MLGGRHDGDVVINSSFCVLLVKDRIKDIRMLIAPRQPTSRCHENRLVDHDILDIYGSSNAIFSYCQDIGCAISNGNYLWHCLGTLTNDGQVADVLPAVAVTGIKALAATIKLPQCLLGGEYGPKSILPLLFLIPPADKAVESGISGFKRKRVR